MLQLCVLKKGRKIPNHLYFRKMAKKSRPARKQLCTKHKQLHRSRVVGLKSPMSTRSKWHSSLLGEQMVKAISEPVCLYVFIAKKKNGSCSFLCKCSLTVTTRNQTGPYCHSPEGGAKWEKSWKLWKMFLYLKFTIFLATGVTLGPSAFAHCGYVIPAGN